MLLKSWESLIKPYKVSFEKEENLEYFEKIVVEPLEKGFGVTLGNALRRVLLSSIQGTAVTSIYITNSVLEFSSLPGVAEDVTDIILNIKDIDLALTGEFSSPQKFLIDVKGPCIVTAGMIQSDSRLKILDPSQVICTLAEGASLQMELFVSQGKGYVPASLSSFQGPRRVGEIVLDARFNPIKKVSYQVEHTRIAQSTDYDRLILFIQTNGSLTPKDAVNQAALVLQDQLKQFISFDPDIMSKQPRVIEQEAKQPAFPPVFFKLVKDLELTVRCLNCLQNEGIVYVGDLVKKRDIDLLRTPNFGRKSLGDINDALGRYGLSLGMNYPDWPPENIEAYLTEHQEGF